MFVWNLAHIRRHLTLGLRLLLFLLFLGLFLQVAGKLLAAELTLFLGMGP